MMSKGKSMGEYVSRLASECDVLTGEFVEALLAAKEEGKSVCGDLFIEFRGKTKTQSTFLVRKGSEVVAQFPVPTDFFLKAGESFMSFVTYAPKTSRREDNQNESSISRCIRDIRAGMKHINLEARVLEITAPRKVETRYGTVATMTKALIGDETGKIQLCLWNGQGEHIAVGKTIKIENAKASNFKGETQLSLMPGSGTCRVNPFAMVSPSQPELQIA